MSLSICVSIFTVFGIIVRQQKREKDRKTEKMKGAVSLISGKEAPKKARKKIFACSKLEDGAII